MRWARQKRCSLAFRSADCQELSCPIDDRRMDNDRPIQEVQTGRTGLMIPPPRTLDPS